MDFTECVVSRVSDDEELRNSIKVDMVHPAADVIYLSRSGSLSEYFVVTPQMVYIAFYGGVWYTAEVLRQFIELMRRLDSIRKLCVEAIEKISIESINTRPPYRGDTQLKEGEPGA